MVVFNKHCTVIHSKYCFHLLYDFLVPSPDRPTIFQILCFDVSSSFSSLIVANCFIVFFLLKVHEREETGEIDVLTKGLSVVILYFLKCDMHCA